MLEKEITRLWHQIDDLAMRVGVSLANMSPEDDNWQGYQLLHDHINAAADHLDSAAVEWEALNKTKEETQG